MPEKTTTTKKDISAILRKFKPFRDNRYYSGHVIRSQGAMKGLKFIQGSSKDKVILAKKNSDCYQI